MKFKLVEELEPIVESGASVTTQQMWEDEMIDIDNELSDSSLPEKRRAKLEKRYKQLEDKFAKQRQYEKDHPDKYPDMPWLKEQPKEESEAEEKEPAVINELLDIGVSAANGWNVTANDNTVTVGGTGVSALEEIKPDTDDKEVLTEGEDELAIGRYEVDIQDIIEGLRETLRKKETAYLEGKLDAHRYAEYLRHVYNSVESLAIYDTEDLEECANSDSLVESIVDDINQGDLVDFGAYGKLYVCDDTYSEKFYWVTDEESDRFNRDASGWSIEKGLAQSIVEPAFGDELDEALKCEDDKDCDGKPEEPVNEFLDANVSVLPITANVSDNTVGVLGGAVSALDEGCESDETTGPLAEDAKPNCIVGFVGDGTRKYYNVEKGWVEDPAEASTWMDLDEARDVWAQIDKSGFRRVFVPIYDLNAFLANTPKKVTEKVEDTKTEECDDNIDKKLTESYSDEMTEFMNWIQEYRNGTLWDAFTAEFEAEQDPDMDSVLNWLEMFDETAYHDYVRDENEPVAEDIKVDLDVDSDKDATVTAIVDTQEGDENVSALEEPVDEFADYDDNYELTDDEENIELDRAHAQLWGGNIDDEAAEEDTFEFDDDIDIE